jgi:hypothetical protein
MMGIFITSDEFWYSGRHYPINTPSGLDYRNGRYTITVSGGTTYNALDIKSCIHNTVEIDKKIKDLQKRYNLAKLRKDKMAISDLGKKLDEAWGMRRNYG